MSDFLKLTNDEEERLKKSLLDFVQLCSSGKATSSEIAQLPIVLNLFITANCDKTLLF